ncbi:MAG: hypothetical protein JXR95_13335 [Deltaproteobacteria bacterium]|nr:hypothetical protein [Deltaproteobacteria bacterium]
MALLSKRGLNQEKINEVGTLLETAKTWTAPDSSWTVSRDQLEAARDEMWAWYQDWAKTARTVVPNKQLRIMMGISSPARPDSPESPDTPDTLEV